MHKILVVALLFFYLQSYSQPSIHGHWEGGINRMGAIQVLRFDIYTKGDSLWATFDDPASAVFNAPFYYLGKQGDTLLMNFGYGKFKAVLHKDVNEITGINTGWNPRLELHMRKYGEKPKPSFSEENIKIKNADLIIAASLFKPSKTKSYPMVVLVHGSDEVTRSTGYYYSLAYNLAEKGIGVLLYDKRGCGKTTGDLKNATFTDLALDAVACVKYLKQRKDLPVKKIGLLGTSQGGWVSYIAAKKSKDIQFIIANVGAAVSLFQQDVDRVQYSMQDDSYDKENIDSAVVYAKDYFSYVSGKITWQQFLPKKEVATKSTFADYVTIPQKDKDEDYWWWKNNNYDPAKDLASITCPVLSLMGEKDVLVPPASNENLMKKYLSQAGVDYQVKVFPNCGHSMEAFSTLKGSAWSFPEKFWIWKQKAPGFYEMITMWILGL